MERSREAIRASNMLASNGSSKRRHRTNILRYSSEEGQLDLQETMEIRERSSKRDRDRESIRWNKRRRGESNREQVEEEDDKEEGEESDEDRVGDEEDGYEVDIGVRVTRMISPTTTSSASNQRRSSLPPRGAKQQAWKVADEKVIGAPVPRKARSASAKRLHEYTVSGNCGNGTSWDRRCNPEPSDLQAVPPSSSSVSVRKRMKSIRPRTQSPNVFKGSSSSVQPEDIEIEIAEVLYGLKKQSQRSKEQETIENSLHKRHPDNTNSTQTTSQTPILPQNKNHASDPLLAEVPKNKMEDEKLSGSSVQNCSLAPALEMESKQTLKMEISSPELQIESDSHWGSCEASNGNSTRKAASGLLESRSGVMNHEDSKALTNDLLCGNEVVMKEYAVSTKAEIGHQELIATEGVSFDLDVGNQREEKSKIDLMKEGTFDQEEEKVERPVKKERPIDEVGEEKMDTSRGSEYLRLYLEDPNPDSSTNVEQQGQKQKLRAATEKIEKAEKSGSLPMSFTLGGWSSNLSPLRHMPPVQTVVPVDGVAASSTIAQSSHILLTQPRPKRCVTHHYIAQQIYLHQQFAKMNHFSVSLRGDKPENLNAVPSGEYMSHNNRLEKNILDMNITSAEERRQASAKLRRHAGKDKSSETCISVDTSQRELLVLQQKQQVPVPSGNLVTGPAFITPLSQHQVALAATSNRSGSSKTTNQANNASLPDNPATAAFGSSSALPTLATAVSFNHPNLATNEGPAPYMAIIKNNGYSFPTVDTTSTYRGSGGQAIPFYNGSFYSSQLYPSHFQQQHPPAKSPSHMVKPINQFSGSSSTQKQPQTQHQWVLQVGSSNLPAVNTMHQGNLQNQLACSSNQSHKPDTETIRDNTASDGRTPNGHKNVYAQNFALPVQSLNFTLLPSTTMGSSGVGTNNGENQQSQSHSKGLKGSVELLPSQAFSVSYTSLNGNKGTSNINFALKAQNPTIFPSFPDIAQQGLKKHPASEGRTGGSSTNHDDGTKGNCKRPSVTTGQTLIFGNGSRTLNFMSSPLHGNWPPHSISPTVISTNSPITGNTSNSQQQKQHGLQQQLTAVTRSKTPVTSSLHDSSIAAKFPSNPPVLSPSLIQCNSSVQLPHQKNLVTSTPKNVVPQQHGRVPPGQTQICFGGSAKQALPPQGQQQIPCSSHSPSQSVTGCSASGGNLRTNSTGVKAVSPISNSTSSQQGENSMIGTCQKSSSPVCGRNMPSILSTCPGHISELKY